MLHPSLYADVAIPPQDVPYLILPPYLPSTTLRLPQPTWQQHSHEIWGIGPESGVQHVSQVSTPSPTSPMRPKRDRKKTTQTTQTTLELHRAQPPGEVQRLEQQRAQAQAVSGGLEQRMQVATATAPAASAVAAPPAEAPAETATCAPTTVALASAVAPVASVAPAISDAPASCDPPGVESPSRLRVAGAAWRPQLFRGEPETEAAAEELRVEEPPATEDSVDQQPPIAEPLLVADDRETTWDAEVYYSLDPSGADQLPFDAAEVVESSWAAEICDSLDPSGADAYFSDDDRATHVTAPSDKVVVEALRLPRKLSDSTTASAHSTPFDVVLGKWQDQKGSRYEVTFDDDQPNATSCSVKTVRPGGEVRTTRSLIKLLKLGKSREKRVTWSTQAAQYVLHPSSSSEIRWVARGWDTKPFRWTRVLDESKANVVKEDEYEEENPTSSTRSSRRCWTSRGAVWRPVERPAKAAKPQQPQVSTYSSSSRESRWWTAARWQAKAA